MRIFPSGLTFDDRVQYSLILLLRLSTIVAIGIAVYRMNGAHILNGLAALALLFAPDFIERKYSVKLPIEYSFAIVLFVYAAIVLGGIGEFYTRFWWWDDLLHITSGVLLGFAGFIVLYSLKLMGKLKASRFLICVFAFAVALSLGVFWEWFEFFMDALFGTQLQRGGLSDTMADLMTDALGALISVSLGYRFMAKEDGRGAFGRMVHNFLIANPHIRKKHD